MASATTQPPDTQPPTAPGNLTATAVSGTQINLSWTASTDNVGVTGYLVERCQGAGSTSFCQIGTTTGTTTTYNDTGLTAGTTYSYRVRATDAAGNLSPYSNVATATTPATIPGLVAAYSFTGHRDDGRRLLGQRQHRHDRERDLDHFRQVRRRAGVQRDQCTW